MCSIQYLPVSIYNGMVNSVISDTMKYPNTFTTSVVCPTVVLNVRCDSICMFDDSLLNASAMTFFECHANVLYYNGDQIVVYSALELLLRHFLLFGMCLVCVSVYCSVPTFHAVNCFYSFIQFLSKSWLSILVSVLLNADNDCFGLMTC